MRPASRACSAPRACVLRREAVNAHNGGGGCTWRRSTSPICRTARLARRSRRVYSSTESELDARSVKVETSRWGCSSNSLVSRMARAEQRALSGALELTRAVDDAVESPRGRGKYVLCAVIVACLWRRIMRRVTSRESARVRSSDDARMASRPACSSSIEIERSSRRSATTPDVSSGIVDELRCVVYG